MSGNKTHHLSDKIEIFNIDGKSSSAGNGESAKKKNEEQQQKVGGFRHIVAILALSSIVLANANRQAYNQSLVRMKRDRPNDVTTISEATTDSLIIEESDENIGTSVTSLSDRPSASTSPTDPAVGTISVEDDIIEDGPNEIDDLDDDRFDWTGAQCSLLQSAFAYGYTPFMIPGGRLSEVYGAKWVVFLSGSGSALCSLAVPFLADHSFVLLVMSRVLMGKSFVGSTNNGLHTFVMMIMALTFSAHAGICQTGVSPALYALLTRWLAPEESSVYLPLIKVGVTLGFAIGSLISGFFHWRTTFYLVGFIGILWSLLWMLLVSSDPQDHRLVGPGELKYIKRSRVIRRSTAPTIAESNNLEISVQQTARKKKKNAPWLRILTNPNVIVFIIVKFTVKMSTDTQTVQLPMYLDRVFRVSKELNGSLNGANYIVQASLTGIIAYTAKELILNRTCGLTKTKVRRIFQGASNIGMALGYILISIDASSIGTVYVAVAMIAVSSTFGAAGEAVVPVDLTNKYAASIMAIANSAANLSGAILPPLVSIILGGELDNFEGWRKFWWIISTVLISGGLLFASVMEAEIQEFDVDEGTTIIYNNKQDLSSSLATEDNEAPVLVSMFTARNL